MTRTHYRMNDYSISKVLDTKQKRNVNNRKLKLKTGTSVWERSQRKEEC
jgi:hypothetical protein